MLKRVLLALTALFISSLLQAGEFVLVQIDYPEGPGPQGSYVLAQEKDGLVSLEPIRSTASASKNLPDKVDKTAIVTALEKEHSNLAGKIAVTEIQLETAKLIAAGKVHVMGRVRKSGDQPTATLTSCIAAAEPAEFATITRIEVVRQGRRLLYDLKNEFQAGAKLEPGDVVHVPLKTVFGR